MIGAAEASESSSESTSISAALGTSVAQISRGSPLHPGAKKFMGPPVAVSSGISPPPFFLTVGRTRLARVTCGSNPGRRHLLSYCLQLSCGHNQGRIHEKACHSDRLTAGKSALVDAVSRPARFTRGARPVFGGSHCAASAKGTTWCSQAQAARSTKFPSGKASTAGVAADISVQPLQDVVGMMRLQRSDGTSALIIISSTPSSIFLEPPSVSWSRVSPLQAPPSREPFFVFLSMACFGR